MEEDQPQPQPQSRVLEEATKQLQLLNDAISRINTTRTQLKHRSSQVKSDIRDCVTHQLEALRERETYLLHQVDLIQQAKDAVLKGQEDRLHEALGSLTTALQVEGEGQGSQVQALLNRMRTMNMQPSESDQLSFCADLDLAKDTIANFGRLDGHRIAHGLFDPEASSTSLPRAFEDYDDEEHHVLYKSVTPGKVGNTREITVNVPRLSQRPEDWLLLPADSLSPPKPATDQFLFPPFGRSKVATMMDKPCELGRSSSSTASIHQWLCDIQAGGEVEEMEADFEVISPPPSFMPESSKGSSIEVISFPEEVPSAVFTLSDMSRALDTVAPPLPTIMTPGPVDPAHTYFKEVALCPSQEWLLAQEEGGEREENTDICTQILRYFHDVSNDTRQWLADYQNKQEACTELCGGASPTPVDIESLGELLCVHDPDPHTWLYTRKDQDGDVDETEVQDLCKANEPCQSFSQCLDDDACCSRKPQVIGGYFEKVTQQGSSGWLIGGPVVEVEKVDVSFPPFAEAVGSQWLFVGDLEARVPPSSFESLVDGGDGDSNCEQWLRRGSSVISFRSLEQSWQSRFSHSLPGSPRRQPKPAEPSSTVDSPLWRLPGNSGSTDTAQWLLTPTSSPTKQPKQAWLAQDSNIKELNHALTKNFELPESSDDECENVMENKSLFECFKSKGVDNKTWLSNVNYLIE